MDGGCWYPSWSVGRSSASILLSPLFGYLIICCPVFSGISVRSWVDDLFPLSSGSGTAPLVSSSVSPPFRVSLARFLIFCSMVSSRLCVRFGVSDLSPLPPGSICGSTLPPLRGGCLVFSRSCLIFLIWSCTISSRFCGGSVVLDFSLLASPVPGFGVVPLPFCCVPLSLSLSPISVPLAVIPLPPGDCE